MKKLLLLLLLNLNISILNAQENNDSILSDQEKAIKAVNEGEILTLDQILEDSLENVD